MISHCSFSVCRFFPTRLKRFWFFCHCFFSILYLSRKIWRQKGCGNSDESNALLLTRVLKSKTVRCNSDLDHSSYDMKCRGTLVYTPYRGLLRISLLRISLILENDHFSATTGLRNFLYFGQEICLTSQLDILVLLVVSLLSLSWNTSVILLEILLNFRSQLPVQ